jgi:disulfide bond formation protein DsbB
METLLPTVEESNPATPLPRPSAPAKRVLGMTTPQLIVIAVLAVALLCILAIFAYILFTSPTSLLP